MVGQRYLILALVVLFVAQILLPSVAVARSRKKAHNKGKDLRSREDTDSTGTPGTANSNSEDDDDGTMAAQCVVSIVNFVIDQFNSIIRGIGSGIATCIDVCDLGAAECASCIATVIPPIPQIPAVTDLTGCS